MSSGNDAIGVGLKMVIYLDVPSLGHTLFVDGSKFYVNQNPDPDIAFLKMPSPLEIGLQHISASG